MEPLSDYEFLNDNSDSTSSIFIANHKPTGKMFRLQTISCTGLSENDQKSLMNKIKIRTNLSHPNVLHFHDYIQHDSIIYLKQEYCGHGTLASFIQKECIEKDRQLREELICRILYQTVFALKTLDCFMGQLNLDTIMLNDEYNIKLYNFFNVKTGGNKNQKQKEVKMSQLGAVVFELCTLETFETSTFDNVLNAQQCYTNTFKDLLISMIKDGTEIRKHINKILCHPTVLLESSRWSKERCFIEKDHQQQMKKSASSEVTDNISEGYTEKLDKLRRKEAALQIKEQLLKEQERKLAQREKKLQIMEKNVKEKMQQAELYLKRYKEGGKSISSGSSSRSSSRSKSSSNKVLSYEDSDPNYVSCGDSDVFPTSTKLQVDKIVKPQSFSRTLSERRIRFKTSPLKDHNFSRKRDGRKSLRHPKIIFEEHTIDLENVPPKIQMEETNSKDSRRKSLFLSNDYENEFVTIDAEYDRPPCQVNNIGWTEETKKCAFEMLRLMKGDEKENADIKHTYL